MFFGETNFRQIWKDWYTVRFVLLLRLWIPVRRILTARNAGSKVVDIVSSNLIFPYHVKVKISGYK